MTSSRCEQVSIPALLAALRLLRHLDIEFPRALPAFCFPDICSDANIMIIREAPLMQGRAQADPRLFPANAVFIKIVIPCGSAQVAPPGCLATGLFRWLWIIQARSIEVSP